MRPPIQRHHTSASSSSRFVKSASARGTRAIICVATATVAALIGVLCLGPPANALGAQVELGTAASYAVLAGTTVTNTGSSTISGNVGVHDGSEVTGFPPGMITNGVIHAADAAALQAKSDLTLAYDEAAGRSSSETISADLAGRTLVSGVYTGTTLGLSGALTLDADGDPDAVFVFQSASTLITESASTVNLIGGAQACNVFWQVGSSATLGTDSDFSGTVLASTAVTALTGASIAGRLLASTAAVTLDNNTITAPTCEPDVVPTDTDSAAASASAASSAAAASSASAASASVASAVSASAASASVAAAAAAAAAAESSRAAADAELAATGPDVSIPIWLAVLSLLAGSLLIAAGRRPQAGRHR